MGCSAEAGVHIRPIGICFSDDVPCSQFWNRNKGRDTALVFNCSNTVCSPYIQFCNQLRTLCKPICRFANVYCCESVGPA
jgi:hypothetical protein